MDPGNFWMNACKIQRGAMMLPRDGEKRGGLDNMKCLKPSPELSDSFYPPLPPQAFV